MTRLRQLEKRFERNQSFFSDYKNYIKDMAKGNTREASSQPAGTTWYILHGGSTTLQSQKKLRWSLTAVQNMDKHHLIES